MALNVDLSALGVELDEEQAQKLLDAVNAAHDEDVQGLKAKNNELISRQKQANSKLEALESQFEGLDIDSLKRIAQQAGQDEESKLIAEGKLDEVVNRRTEKMRSDFERQLNEERQKREQSEQFANRYQDKVLADGIKSGALKAGAINEALDDFVFRGKTQFKLNEYGEPVAVDKDGEVIYGKDGRTPLTPAEWAEGLRETAPHLFPRAVGTGAPGSGGKATKSLKDMSEAEITELHRNNPDKLRELKANS
ncbi:hypothetical protein [Vreelandella populi]|uniref:hypothetical protein n=1 Tax=Vreelandella populi TaxID=2498858 RepID=UPI000F8E93DF|nr:hypothetical protein [Halomonas populi]RUR52703.1 hypothetical protein ELY40_11675 [Halomonas populi]